MMRSLFSAISGLKNFQTFMDVVGNNIANINTTGYKAGRVTFQDVLSQSLRGASAPVELSSGASRAGTNPVQVGLGSMLSGIETMQTQGYLQATGQPTDLAIQGDGYFILTDGQRRLYSRDGAFGMDATDGTLLNPASGLRILGWVADVSTGEVDATQPLTTIPIPIGRGMVASATTTATLGGNLDSETTAADTYSTTTTVYDGLGNARSITMTFTNSAANTWTLALTEDTTALTTNPGTITLTFEGGVLPSTGTTSATVTVPAAGSAIAFDFTVDFSALTQLGAASNVVGGVNGAAPGTLTSFTVGQAGEVFGIYSNGITRQLGQIALAVFPNPAGLNKSGGNRYEISPNSGEADIGAPGSGRRGTLSSGYLEMSNVDLAQEFTGMIMAQKGFQASTRVITAADEMLQDLVNLKR